MRVFTALFFLFLAYITNAQSVAINTDGSLADTSALLDVKSYKKGVLFPRMNSQQRMSIAVPAPGLLVFDVSTNTFWFYGSTGWTEIRGSGTANPWLMHNNGIYYNSGNVGIGTLPHVTFPLYVRQPNTGTGNSIAHFESEDTWHSAITIRNTLNQRQYALVVGGPNNLELFPNNFGILNSNLIKWAIIVNGTNNNVGFGSPDIHSSAPKSTVHVFTGDVNIEQIGSGIIMKSPNGQCWRVTIDNTGNFVRTAITCP